MLLDTKMHVIILTSFLSLIGAFLGLDGFLFCFSSLLLLPVLYFKFGFYFENPIYAYFSFIFIISIFTGYSLIYFEKLSFLNWLRSISASSIFTKLEGYVVFIVFYLFFYSLSVRWSDFYSLGERLRDLALIGAGISEPVFIQEPWMAGVKLNYYAYWYRFCHLLSVFLGLKHYQIYHIIVSMAPSFLRAVIYKIFRNIYFYTKQQSFYLSALLLISSNPAGIKLFFMNNSTWWYPSRVIKGTISEFPAWSFLLGDAHPHYLNSSMIVFFLYLSFQGFKAKKINNILVFFVSLIVPSLFFKNANMWEVPFWLGIVAAFTFMVMIYAFLNYESFKKELTDLSILNKETILFISIFSFLAVSLYHMSLNFVATKYPIGVVKSSSDTVEFLLHWGFFLFPILYFQFYNTNFRILALLLLSLLFPNVLPFLVLLWAVNFFRLFRSFNSELTDKKLFNELIIFCALTFLIVPEIVFLDDPYGSDVDRMNTFFKVSYSNWVIMFLAACYSLSNFRNSKFAIIIFMFMSAFFFKTIPDRINRHERDSVGLSTLEHLYPGAKAAIEYLLTKNRGIVLEAQGNPYSETTMVSTLTNFPSYLGWVNHVDLLLPDKRDEIAHRTEVTDRIYRREEACEIKKQLLIEEEVSYLVVGELEKRAYNGLYKIDLSCLNLVFDNENYKLFSIFPVK